MRTNLKIIPKFFIYTYIYISIYIACVYLYAKSIDFITKCFLQKLMHLFPLRKCSKITWTTIQSLDPYLSLSFSAENLKEDWHLPLHSNSMFSLKLAIATCNKRCQYRDRALLQWQRHAGSGIECSLGWMVVLQAPGKLSSQYHFQYVVFLEALTKKDAYVKTQLFHNFQLFMSHYYRYWFLLFQMKAETWNSWGYGTRILVINLVNFS